MWNDLRTRGRFATRAVVESQTDMLSRVYAQMTRSPPKAFHDNITPVSDELRFWRLLWMACAIKAEPSSLSEVGLLKCHATGLVFPANRVAWIGFQSDSASTDDGDSTQGLRMPVHVFLVPFLFYLKQWLLIPTELNRYFIHREEGKYEERIGELCRIDALLQKWITPSSGAPGASDRDADEKTEKEEESPGSPRPEDDDSEKS